MKIKVYVTVAQGMPCVSWFRPDDFDFVSYDELHSMYEDRTLEMIECKSLR